MSAKFQNKGEGDLFEQFQQADAKLKRKTKLILPSLKETIELSYENVIFLAIAFIILSAAFFSLGVEKGRRERPDDEKQERTIAIDTLTAEKKEPEPLKQEEVYPKNKYIIQLASFANAGSAEEEAGRLQKDGYRAEVKKSGSYYQVFIGGFYDRKTAEAALAKLTVRYRDGYIKKIEEE